MSSQGVLTQALPATLAAFPQPRALPTHPIHRLWRKILRSALVPMGSTCQSALCLHSALLDLLPATLAPPAAQEATWLPTSSSQSLV